MCSFENRLYTKTNFVVHHNIFYCALTNIYILALLFGSRPATLMNDCYIHHNCSMCSSAMVEEKIIGVRRRGLRASRSRSERKQQYSPGFSVVKERTCLRAETYTWKIPTLSDLYSNSSTKL